MDTRKSEITTLMVVEDSDEDFEALSRAFHKLGLSSRIQRCRNGQECLNALRQLGTESNGDKWQRPSLILLDLNLPGMDGREALREIKSDPALKTIPVTILTTSSNTRDVEACYAGGANAYVLKSLNYDDFSLSIQSLATFWLGVVTGPPCLTSVKE